MKKKILYLMHVDWHWIKQRPHFLAEGLSAEFDVLVTHPHSNRRAHLIRNKTNLFRVPMWSLPFARFKAISFINTCIKNLYFWGLILIYRPSVVWFTFPTLVPQFGLRLLKNKVIVYDCMDDAQEFKSNEIERQYILHKEKDLLRYANIVLVSSNNLYNKVLGRGTAANKVALVRNAFGGVVNVKTTTISVSATSKDKFHILYIGTISDYLDFDVLLHCINSIEGVEFHFFGPVLIAVPAHEKLKFYGAVEHSTLAERVQQFDCFVMPFILNELVQGVDPVKLYEYINFNKNIICPYYAEINRFSKFVSFYSNKDEFVAVIKNLLDNNELKFDSKQRRLFLESNCWAVRTAKVTKLIGGYLQMVP